MADTVACIICGVRAPYEPSLCCGGCFARMRTDLATAAWAYGWLGATMMAYAPGWKPGTIHRRGESAPPFAVALHDARVEIEDCLHKWARLIGEEHTPALAGPAGSSIMATTIWLRARLQWCSDQPWCDEYAGDLQALRRRAHGLAPWERSRRDLPVPCPRCRYLSLSLYGGDDGVTCRNRDCGHLIPWWKYEREVKRWHDRMSQYR